MIFIKKDFCEFIRKHPLTEIINEWKSKDEKARTYTNLAIEDYQIHYVKNENKTKGP